MPFNRPSLQEICDRIQSDIETRNPTIGSLLRRSVLKVLSRSYGGAVHLLYGFLDYKSKQIQALTADQEGLNTIATEYGISRTAATQATGTITLTGTNDIVIPSGTKLQSSSGVVYTTDDDSTILAGTVDINITAKEAGEDGNNDGGITLSFISPITGVNTSGTVTTDGLVGGSDEETDDSLRERVLIRKRQPPHGGAYFDYITWAREVSGVTRAWTFPDWAGRGTIGLAFTRDNDSTIIPTADLADDVFEYLQEHTDPASGLTVGIPVGSLFGLSIFSSDGIVTASGTTVAYYMTTYPVNLSISIYPNTIDIQDAIEAELETMLYNDGGAGISIPLSRISEAISAAYGLIRHRVISPTSDISTANNEVHILGTITWENYA